MSTKPEQFKLGDLPIKTQTLVKVSLEDCNNETKVSKILCDLDSLESNMRGAFSSGYNYISSLHNEVEHYVLTYDSYGVGVLRETEDK